MCTVKTALIQLLETHCISQEAHYSTAVPCQATLRPASTSGGELTPRCLTAEPHSHHAGDAVLLWQSNTQPLTKISGIPAWTPWNIICTEVSVNPANSIFWRCLSGRNSLKLISAWQPKANHTANSKECQRLWQQAVHYLNSIRETLLLLKERKMDIIMATVRL